LAISQPTVSHHLKVLQGAGITTSYKEGTWTYHKLRTAGGDALAPAVALNFLELAASASQNGHTNLLARDKEAINEILARRRDASHRYFESVASNWREIRREAQGDTAYFPELATLIPDKGILVELGCGSGALLEAILPRAGRTIGVDYSRAMLDEARRNLGEKAKNVDLRLGELEHLPLANDSVDVAVACMVLHHIAQPERVIREAARVLKREGRFIVVDLVHHTNEYMRERFADLWLGFEPRDIESWLKNSRFKTSQTKILGERQEVFIVSTLKP
jgi:ArsR family transcriptional regulator